MSYIRSLDALSAEFAASRQAGSVAADPDDVASETRGIPLRGGRAVLRLEQSVWLTLEDIARQEHLTLPSLIGAIDDRRPQQVSLSSAVRSFVVMHLLMRLREAAADTPGQDGGLALSGRPAAPARPDARLIEANLSGFAAELKRLPILDPRDPDDILGYGPEGLPS